MSIVDSVFDTLDSALVWLSNSFGQFAETYCDLETADSRQTLVAKDGSLLSILKIHGATFLVGPEEFQRLHRGLTQALQSALSRPGHAIQVFFMHDKETVARDLEQIIAPGRQTAQKLGLNLDDLFAERINELQLY